MWLPGWAVGRTPAAGASSNAAMPSATTHLRRTTTAIAEVDGTGARCAVSGTAAFIECVLTLDCSTDSRSAHSHTS